MTSASLQLPVNLRRAAPLALAGKSPRDLVGGSTAAVPVAGRRHHVSVGLCVSLAGRVDGGGNEPPGRN
ncbi:hypothetical protein BO78DRAFT_397206 [Aspergillus sclerotiicarbonarius CBS 121057]|uniref:Uncharacterized protein n=1 Tax=Aspergillus sclerotiicarbonarius (strain CBS 121057 / IBT 28362) TaxID=1448318 RepID=A0A319E9J3_ASPSB|nr:hypothetical protein BO78DRAFT_397206 [Aspergillus sclerotiicarbonarius CBS 121057]